MFSESCASSRATSPGSSDEKPVGLRAGWIRNLLPRCQTLLIRAELQGGQGHNTDGANDENKDSPILIIYGNVHNPSREDAVFDIDSEEAIAKK